MDLIEPWIQLQSNDDDLSLYPLVMSDSVENILPLAFYKRIMYTVGS